MTFGDFLDWMKNIPKRIGDKISNLRKEEKCGNIVAEAIRRNFVDSKAPDGTSWAPLKYRTGKPLILTGLLMNEAVEAGRKAVVTKEGIVATLSTPFYAGYHNDGTSRIPKREFFGIDERGKSELSITLGEFIVSAITVNT